MDQSAIARLRILAAPAWVKDSTKPATTSETSQDQSDEVLLAMIGQDRKSALSAFFRRHSKAVFNVGRRILRDPGEAEDLVQDVFLYVYRKSTLYHPGKGSARSWLMQVAYTQAFQRRRKLKGQGYYQLSAHDTKPPDLPESNVSAYDETVEGLFGRNRWRRMFESLSAEQRETLKLYFFEGLTFAEIAEKLGQSYSNVRNHHYRGLEKLRRHLAESSLNRR